MLTEPAARLRDWALFAIAALLPAISVGAIGMRALTNEEAAVEREAKIALAASADRVVREITTGLEAAANQLAHEPSKLVELTPIFAEAIVLGPDRSLIAPALSPSSETTTATGDTRCQDRLNELARTRETRARVTLRSDLLASCGEARATSGRWIYPMVAIEGFSAADSSSFTTWVTAHAAKLSSLERAAITEDLRNLPLDADARTKAMAALASPFGKPTSLPSVLREQEANDAVHGAVDGESALRWHAPGSIGSLRAIEGGRLAGFVVHRASLEAAAARGWPSLPSEARATFQDAKAADGPNATRALTTSLPLVISLRDPSSLARRTVRSRRILGAAALAATIGAFAFAALLFARMRAARRASALRTDFVAAVSHELRTPIASVRMLAELLEQNRVEEDERAEIHTALANEARRLGDTVGRLLGFARMASNKRVLTKTEANVSDAVEESVALFETRHPELAPVVRAYDRTLVARFDRSEISLVIDNLLTNARKYAPEGKPYAVRIESEKNGVAISVEDRGPGITKRDQNRIFEAFERADDRLSKATEGTGIGLSLVRHVAHAHGGEIRLDSDLGRGARFTLWIPRGRE